MSSGLALEVGLAWPGPLLRAARGPDGADLALLADLDDHLAAGSFRHRFSRVVIGGGDHIYEPAARRLTAAGTQVVVVSRPEALARCLRESGDRAAAMADRSATTAGPSGGQSTIAGYTSVLS